MKPIIFTKEELEHMRGYYQLELAEAEKEIIRIKDILSKLGTSNTVITELTIDKVPGKRGRKAKAVSDVPVLKVPGKRGRKPKLKPEATVAAEPKKRGPKPKVKDEAVVKKVRKQRSDKGGIRGKHKSTLLLENLEPSTPFVSMIDPVKDKPAIPKKAKKKKQFKKRGITLAPMGKPLPKRAPEPESTPSEPPSEISE
ncbi:MAG: hypothetical protein WCO44_00925 [Bacteroidota bacterium]